MPLKLPKSLRRPPLQIANELAALLSIPESFARVSVAPPGFINLRLERAWLQAQVEPIGRAGRDWGRNVLGKAASIQVEFVSSNPTGPMLFSHARGAVVGDVIARVLEASGYAVQREYYLNDAGRQVRQFGESILARIRGEDVPEGGYKGEYISEIAQAARSKFGDSARAEDLAEFGMSRVIETIREDLRRLDIEHHNWFSERSLYTGWERVTLDKLRAAGRVTERDGAVWFVTGTDKDEVLYKSDGYPTYFASDVFYHRDKLERRHFEQVIDVWGADHQGAVGRLKLAVEALGIDPNRLRILLVQLVMVQRGDEAVRMSRRAGVGVLLKEMLDEVGADAVRYFFLLRSADAPMTFDIDLAKKQSNENPVYYAQYANARLANVLTFGSGATGKPDFQRLDSEWELELMRVMLRWPDIVREAADTLEPHRLAFYTDELAATIHRFYKNCRVVTDDAALTAARLQLSRAAKRTLENALGLMGVSAPERM